MAEERGSVAGKGPQAGGVRGPASSPNATANRPREAGKSSLLFKPSSPSLCDGEGGLDDL